MIKKDKTRQENIEVDQQALALFFEVGGEEGVAKDFTILEKAYRGLNADYFAEFLKLAKSRGLDFNAQNEAGETMLSIIKAHANGADYAEELANYC